MKPVKKKINAQVAKGEAPRGVGNLHDPVVLINPPVGHKHSCSHREIYALGDNGSPEPNETILKAVVAVPLDETVAYLKQNQDQDGRTDKRIDIYGWVHAIRMKEGAA